jgi:hypothetical protein
MDDAFAALRDAFGRHASQLGTPTALPTVRQDSGAAHVEYRDGAYHYVVTERGTELERRVATDANELLYWLLSDAAFGLATAHAARERGAGRSFRRALFAKEIELLERLDPAWATRKRDEIAATLLRAPFDATDG